MLGLKRYHDTETKSESSCEQDNRPELAEDVETSDNENLIDFFLLKLDEKSSFEQIRKVAKIAIMSGMGRNNSTKKNWIISELKKLEKLEVSIKMQTIILAAIEVVVLSRRISNLKKLGIFAKKVAENNNHSWLLNGARLAISTYYPGL